MAEQRQNNPGAVTNTFTKGMVKDYNDTFVGEGLWTHARNAVNNSHDGQLGVIGNEPANLHCVTLPYDLIGVIHLRDDQWAVYTTNDVDSEIGIFDESQCTYTKKVNDRCLNFRRTNLITGISRRRFDCERPVYWADGRNPDRFMDLDNPPFKFTESILSGCVTRTYTNQLDCEKIRLASLVTAPCIVLEKGKGAGTLPNGSYQVCLAYTINQVKITDYLGLSEVQSVFHHDNVKSSLEVKITQVDQNFDEFELVILAQINGETIARRIGYYSTNQGTIYIDTLSNESPTIPINQVVVRTEPIERSDAMYQVNDYALRVGVYTKYKFNYQLQANNIRSSWVAVEYPSEYYKKGGNNTGYMRDEQYAFFIRWVYNTGERSESYHIPGRSALPTEKDIVVNADAYEAANGVTVQRWQVYNTGTIEGRTATLLPDGGRVIGTGRMGYWESTEKYPDDRPDIWGNLCGQPIRHHKFPDETCDSSAANRVLDTFSQSGSKIVILGVQFENITHPLDNNGNPITSIVGYEILRGSRQGNKTIIGKGLLNNMRTFKLPEDTTNERLFQNYPFNDLRADSYLTTDFQSGTNGSPDPKSSKMTGYKKNIFSFHSPETTFSQPFVNATELKVYQQLSGTATGRFITPYKHPKFKLPTNFTDTIGDVLGIVQQIADIAGIIASADPVINLQGTSDLPFTQSLITPHRQDAIAGTWLGTTSGTLGTTGVPGTDQGAATARKVANSIITGANIAVLATLATFKANVTSEQIFRLIIALVGYRQYAVQYVSHGFYNQAVNQPLDFRRRFVTNTSYVGADVATFGSSYQIYNLNRSRFVAVEIPQAAELNPPAVQDNSRFIISERNAELNRDLTSTISSLYGALKIPLDAQYGQLESIKQIPISSCVFNTVANTTSKFTTPVLFGGDIYINRFTEKNNMLFFNTWLMGEPNGAELDYTLYFSMPYARFWVNNTDLNGGLFQGASNFRVLDARESSLFSISKGYFYLFNSGVRDFFVESDVNVAYRDWDDQLGKRHYDPYETADLNLLMRSDVIKESNIYKYDYSLSISKLFNSQITWGNMLSRDYDPKKAETCYVYYPNRVVYSLPQQDDSRKDSWRIYLANNYKTMGSKVTAIKPVNKTGALFMMAFQSPLQFMGVEELKLDGTGAKITIGDGALFSGPQQLQAIVNSDESYEYGSCQNRFATVGCTHGIFWVSQNQGKVFQYQGGLKEISRDGMKWWFANYLPSELLKVYPNYPLYDNPVVGIGVQMIYDNTHEIIYITKKDYRPKRKDLLYDQGGFYYEGPGSTTINICPPGYTLQGNVCVANTATCPPGYQLINGVCTKTETVDPIQTGQVVEVSRTPYEVYGYLGTKVYNTASITGTFTILNTSNSFWIRQSNPANWNSLTPDQKQAFDLNNGPVNRLSIWGRTLSSTTVLNNYNHSGANLNPVNEWIGFDVCINITTTKTYYLAIAADNRYRFFLDGTLVLSDLTTSTNTFDYLHIYPITITAGSHILKMEGYNTGQKAGFGCEIFDLDNRPTGTSVVDFLNAQSSYDNLNVIFTTRNVTQFSSNLYTCPVGYGLANPTCTEPVCQKITTAASIFDTKPPTRVVVKDKIYCNFDKGECWENASWTISYDPKTQTWISFHDWIPSFLIPGKAHFMSVNMNSIWKHNIRCDKYTNFYGIDYPFEVEFVSATGQQINSMRNIEYLLEAYKMHNDCRDKFHVLDANFDQAIIHNSEQISGLLELELKSKTNPVAMLSYPQVRTQSIGINYSKEENKYRFNQFWDITRNRGEFQGVNVPMFNTEPNGYKFQINPTYVNYNKSPLERKKFRHNVNKVFLRKLVSNDTKYLFKISNQKILQSPR